MPPSLPYNDFGVDRPTLPYRSVTSIIDESPHWVMGSANCMATVGGWMAKRPGFTRAVESTLSAIPGKVVRIFTWRRWTSANTHAGSFFVMACAVTSSTSTVWKLEVGVDASFVLIYTATGTTSPFDFVVSRDFCFFGNETTRANMRKFNGSIVSLWGADAPPSPPSLALVSGSLPLGFSFDSSTGTLSGTPAAQGFVALTIAAEDADAATATQTYSLLIGPNTPLWQTGSTLTPAVEGAAYSFTLSVTGGPHPYSWAVTSGVLPGGLTLTDGVISGTPTATGPFAFSIKATDTSGNSATKAFFLFVSAPSLAIVPTDIGAVKDQFTATSLSASGGTAPYSFALVGDLPGGIDLLSDGTLSGTPVVAGTYTFNVQATDAGGLMVQQPIRMDIGSYVLGLTALTVPPAQMGQPYSFVFPVSGGVGPYTLTFSVGSLTAQTGYVYGYTYTSTYGHESSMSALSSSTKLFTDKDVAIDVIASADPQVTGINVYRTSDGGAADPAIMRLLTALGNTTQTYTDATADTDLGSQTGPALYVNNPPQPQSGFVWSNGRIWGKKSAISWFTGNEEVTNGIPEECMSNATDGNYYSWPNEIGGMAATPEGVDIGLAVQFWQISGSTLATFQKNVLLTGGGLRAVINICAVGSTVFWIDTAKQVFSSEAGEIGLAIRPDLANLDPQQTFICYHKSKALNLLCILDAANAQLLTYDLDLNQWNTPWPVPGMTALATGEVTLGNIELLAAYSTGHVRLLTPGVYLDDGAQYGEELVSNLTTVSPGRGTTARNRDTVRSVRWFEAEVSTYPDPDNPHAFLPRTPDQFKALVDDDPVQAFAGNHFFDLSGYIEPMQYEDTTIQKRYLSAWRWGANKLPPGSRVAFAAIWAPSDLGWNLYSFATTWDGR